MYEVSVLKVTDPSCFWCQIIKGNDLVIYGDEDYKKMFEEMNMLYGKTYRDVQEIMPVTIAVGEFCMVFCEELHCWCRATLEAAVCSAEDGLVECFLLDHAIYCPVGKKNVRLPVEACQRLPFRAKKFQLHQVQPISLHFDLYEDIAELGPAKRWDTAATQYFQHLINESTHTEAKLCSAKNNSFSVYLYITTKDFTICVNDELVAKNFACFCAMEISPEMTTIVNSPLAQDSESLQSSGKEKHKEVNNMAQVLWPVLLRRKLVQRHHTGFPVKTKTIVDVTSELEARLDCDEKQDCAKLLQILNPEPLKLSDDQDNEQKPVFKAPRRPIVLRKAIEPCSTLESAPLSSDLKKALMRSCYSGPNFTESYCWPSVAQGYDTIMVSSDGMNPMNYIPPILTFLHFASAAFKLLPARNGPLAVFICPGWKKAHIVHDLLLKYGRYTRPLNPMLILVGLKKSEYESMSLRPGCEVIVTTPHSLLRFLEHHGLLFLRLCHLVLDEVELLFSKSREQILTILENYKKTVAVEDRDSAPQQIVAIGKVWHKEMEHLLHYTTDPQVIITKMEQAAVFGNVQQVVQLCLDCEKMSVLLRTLDFTPSNAQKILIFTKSDDESELVYKAVQNNSLFCLLINEKRVHGFNHVLEQWKKMFSAGTHVVLVVTDEFVPLLDVTDATCVIHFSFPQSPSVFGLRMFSMSDHFQSQIVKVVSLEQYYSRARSVLLMTEKHAFHAVPILHYLQHAEAKIPPELNDFTNGILLAKEKIKFGRKICQYVKAFGYCCNNIAKCPDRHHMSTITDYPHGDSESDQYISVMPLYIVDAARYFGCIVTKEDVYHRLVEELTEYYQSPSSSVSVCSVERSAMYALKDGSIYHRVQVLQVSPKKDDGIVNVDVKYIDEGRTGEVGEHLLLQLPSKFQNIPPQAVEFIVCRVKPIDGEAEWSPKVTRLISRHIKGKLHVAKVVLALGNSYWLDPMVQVSRLSGLATSINELNVRHEILSTGLGTDNPQHVHQLKALYKQAQEVAKDQIECGSRMTEENVPSVHTVPNGVSFPTVLDNKIGVANGTAIAEEKQGQQKPPDHKSWHPEVKWFQKEASLILTVKLRDLADHSCTFYADRVVFSAHAEGKYYLADMGLCHEIISEQSKCVIKNGEAVITLIKANRGSWCTLLKQKHPNVCFDFDRWDDPEASSCFSIVTDRPKNIYTVVSEEVVSSESESESDSD
ncbi:putative ATP-dependent RNA helicase TDRD12 [Ascaphus truei]|uniref:putative ATP-dependent RNA helicase TDRD12 n=1 Tax=Ascaphus truei TaxID=8439 RepID=UPI003F5AC436